MFIGFAKLADRSFIPPMAMSRHWAGYAFRSSTCPFAAGWAGNAWRKRSAMIPSSLLDSNWPEEAAPNRHEYRDTAQNSAMAIAVSCLLYRIPNLKPTMYFCFSFRGAFFPSVTRGSHLRNLSGGTGVIKCTDNTYCCEGDNNCHYDNNTNLVIFQAGTSAFTLISETTATSSATASSPFQLITQSLPISTATPSSQPQSNSSKTRVDKIAIGVGVPCIVITVGIIAALIFFCRRRLKRGGGRPQAGWAPTIIPDITKVPYSSKGTSLPYVSSPQQEDWVAGYKSKREPPAELQQCQNPQELADTAPLTIDDSLSSPPLASYTNSSIDHSSSPSMQRGQR